MKVFFFFFPEPGTSNCQPGNESVMTTREVKVEGVGVGVWVWVGPGNGVNGSR